MRLVQLKVENYEGCGHSDNVNVHDGQAFDGLYRLVTTHYPMIKVVTDDAGYKRL